ncbi:MAG: hypothetical protein RI907_910 [Pseudomonadota bacterium]|jgi:hypothetical protein
MAHMAMMALKNALVNDLRGAWQKLRLLHPQDRFYGFGLYTTDNASYLFATAFTEEGLSAISATYCKKYGGDPCTQSDSLRWSPCDSPLHLEGGDFTNSERIKDEILNRHQDEDNTDEPEQEVFNAALEALLELDKQGLFGAGPVRDKLLLNIWKGDQSDEERIAFARALNAASAVDRFEKELSQGYEAFMKLSK